MLRRLLLACGCVDTKTGAQQQNDNTSFRFTLAKQDAMDAYTLLSRIIDGESRLDFEVMSRLRDLIATSLNNVGLPLAYEPSDFTNIHPDVVNLLKMQLGIRFPSKLSYEKPHANNNTSLRQHSFARVTSYRYDDTDLAFDVVRLNFDTDGCALSTIASHIFKNTGIIAEFSIDQPKLANFLSTIETRYGTNPYHNAVHAANVLHHVHILLCMLGVNDPYKRLKVFLAAIIHDYEHIGLTNTFLVSSQHEYALTHNDMSPMENHSMNAAFHVMGTPDNDFMCNVPLHVRQCLRRDVISLVMSTDMATHFMHISKFRAVYGNKIAKSADLIDLQIVLKCADLGHTFLPTPLHIRWVKLLEEECFLQGDRERNNDMSISPLFDRSKKGIIISQTGFFEMVVLPMVCALCDVYPCTIDVLDAVMANAKHWLHTEDCGHSNVRLQRMVDKISNDGDRSGEDDIVFMDT